MKSISSRDKLARTALELFAQRGFSGVSVDEIAAAAKLTKGAAYYQFQGKKDLFRAACILLLDDLAEEVLNMKPTATSHSVDEIVEDGVKLFDAYETPAMRQLLLIDGPAILGIAEWTKMHERLRIDLTEHALHHLVDASLLEERLVPMLAHLIFGAFMQGVLQIASASSNSEVSITTRDAYRKLASGLLSPLPE